MVQVRTRSKMVLLTVSAVVCLAALLLTTATGCKPSASEKKLYFYTWADYISEDAVKAFEEQFQCKVVFDYFDSNEAMLAKIKSSSSCGYDVIMPTTYTVKVMQDENMLMKLDASKLPNLAKIDPEIAKLTGDEKFEYSVPYYGGITGIGYNAEKLGQAPDSWKIYEDAKFQGRMTLLEDFREVFAAALMTLGYDVNTTDEAQLAEARDLIISWKKNIAKFGVDDVKQGLQNGEFFVVHGYSGDIIQFTTEDPNIQFAIPKEGAIISYDHFVIPADAANADLAHEFINFMCDPKNAALNMDATQYAVPIPEAMELVSPELKASAIFNLTPEQKANLHMTRDLGADNAKYSKMWDEVKAAK